MREGEGGECSVSREQLAVVSRVSCWNWLGRFTLIMTDCMAEDQQRYQASHYQHLPAGGAGCIIIVLARGEAVQEAGIEAVAVLSLSVPDLPSPRSGPGRGGAGAEQTVSVSL